MDGDERQRDLDRVAEAHAALDDHLTAMSGSSGADSALPSLLPGWSRGHLLTHIARNADSFVRVLEAARRGEAVTQYEGGGAGRNADIEAGASRDWDTAGCRRSIVVGAARRGLCRAGSLGPGDDELAG